MAQTFLQSSPVSLNDEDNPDIDHQMTVTSLSGKPLLNPVAGNETKLVPQRSKWTDEERERLRKDFVPPDGGYGWFVAFGAFMVQFWVAGLIKSYGVIFLEVLQLFPDASASLASWIPAMLATLSLLFAPLVSALCQRFSCRVVVFIGGLFSCAGLTLSFFVKSLIQLCFTFGVIAGIGAGLSTTPGIIMTSRYFTKRRALANGICISGTAAGSIILPPLIETLVPRYGFKGTILILGACMLHVCLSAVLYRPIEVHQRIIEISRRKSTRPGKQVTEEEADALNLDEEINGYTRRSKADLPDGSHCVNVNLVNSAQRDRLSKLMGSKTNLYCSPPEQPSRKNSARGSLDFKKKTENTSPLDLTVTEELSSAIFHRQRLDSCLTYSIEDLSTSSAYVHRDSVSKVRASVPKEALLLKPNAEGSSKHGCCSGFRRYIDIKLLRNQLFLLMCVTVMLMSVGCPHMLFYMPTHVNSLGYSKGDAGLLLSTSAVFDLAGRLLSGYIADFKFFQASHGYLVSMAVAGTAVLCIPWVTNYWLLGVVVSFYGFGLGSWYLYIPVILAEHHGTEAIASSYGLTRMFQGAIALVVPPFAGFLRDVTGSYVPCFLFMGCSMMLAASLMFLEPCAKKLSEKGVDEKCVKEGA